MTATELRAQLRMQRGCNKGATTPNGSPAAVASDAHENGSPRYRWRVIEASGKSKEVCCLPEMTADEIRACYPGACLMPLPDNFQIKVRS
jgi:hypothetical protein